MQLLPGLELAEQIINNLRSKTSTISIVPQLAIIQVGDEEASNVYISKKMEVAKRIGINIKAFKYLASEIEKAIDQVKKLNTDNSINGIIVQLPVPGDKNNTLSNTIIKEKDIDGLTISNLGSIWYPKKTTLGATPKAIYFALQYIAEKQGFTNLEFFSGKNILIINNNILIGKPLAGVLTNMNSTVTLANIHTNNLENLFQYADIIISATGTNIINSNNTHLLKDNVILIDSGFSRVDGKVLGDIDLNSVKDKASWITPVPGGIGPLGVAMLMQNVYEATLSQISYHLPQQ